MDEAARQTGIDRARCAGATSSGPSRCPTRTRWARPTTSAASSRSWTRRWRWPTGAASRRARQSKARGKLRGLGISTFLEWTGGNVFEERVTRGSEGRRRDRGLLRRQPDGAGHRDHAGAAGGRRVRRADREGPRGAGRHRPRRRLRQRRLAFALHRRLGAAPRARRRRWTGARELAAEALEAAAADLDYAAGGSASRAPTWHRPVRAGGEPAGPAHLHRPHSAGGGAELAQRLPRQRGGDRPADRRGAGRALCERQRRRPRGQPDDRARPARWRRGAGHRPGPDGAHGLRRAAAASR